MSPSKTCSGSFLRSSNCVSKEKETKKCDSSLCKIVLKQYFDLNFSRLKVKQEPKFREYDFVGNIFTWYIRLKKGPPKKRNVPLNIVDWDMLPP